MIEVLRAAVLLIGGVMQLARGKSAWSPLCKKSASTALQILLSEICYDFAMLEYTEYNLHHL